MTEEAVVIPEKEKKKDKNKKEKKSDSKKINVKIAPGNWTRLEKCLDDYNKNPERTTSKLKYTNVLNEAVSAFLQNKQNQ